MEQIQTHSSEEALTGDWKWDLLGINWFLIVSAILLARTWDTLPVAMGMIVAAVFVAGVPTAILYAVLPNRETFRWRRSLALFGWVATLVSLYPLFACLGEAAHSISCP